MPWCTFQSENSHKTNINALEVNALMQHINAVGFSWTEDVMHITAPPPPKVNHRIWKARFSNLNNVHAALICYLKVFFCCSRLSVRQIVTFWCSNPSAPQQVITVNLLSASAAGTIPPMMVRSLLLSLMLNFDFLMEVLGHSGHEYPATAVQGNWSYCLFSHSSK